MLEYRCTSDGFWFYDPVLGTDIFASNTLLFLLGYSRVFGDIKVSDKLFIPHYITNSDGIPIALTNRDFLLSARSYLTDLATVETTDAGDLFELNGLSLVLEGIGYLNYYKSSSSFKKELDRVPHVPLFTKRSQDYKRIKDILTTKTYWNTEDKWDNEEEKEEYYQKPKAGLGDKENNIDPYYTVYNMDYKGDRAEALDLYKSFGSLNYILNTLYPNVEKPVKKYADYCSWFIWDSLAFTQLYQFSLGVLYGMSQLGWGIVPYSMRPTEYNPYFKYITLVDEAFFWFQNTPFDLIGSNELLNIDPALFRIDTYPVISSRRVLSSSIDQSYQYDPVTNKYSVDGGNTWITLEELEQWALDNNGALPVNGYTNALPLYRGSSVLNIPLSDGVW